MINLDPFTTGRPLLIYGSVFCLCGLYFWSIDQTDRPKNAHEIRPEIHVLAARRESSLAVGSAEQTQPSRTTLLFTASGLLLLAGSSIMAVRRYLQSRPQTDGENSLESLFSLLIEPTDALLTLSNDGKIVTANAQAASLFGCPEAILSTKSLKDLACTFRFCNGAPVLSMPSFAEYVRAQRVVRNLTAVANTSSRSGVALELSAVWLGHTNSDYITLIVRNVQSQIDKELVMQEQQSRLVKADNEVAGLNWLHDQMSQCVTHEEVGSCLSSEAAPLVEVSEIQLWRRARNPSLDSVRRDATSRDFDSAWTRVGHSHPLHLGTSASSIPTQQSLLTTLNATNSHVRFSNFAETHHYAEQIWARAHGLNALAAYYLETPGSYDYVLIAYDIAEFQSHRADLLALIARVAAANIYRLDQANSSRLHAKAKAEFLANISHAIRTPLSSILGFSELLAEEVGLDRAPPHRRNSILAIRRNGDELHSIVEDIQEFARVESGDFDLTASPCCPMQILIDTVALLRHRADQKSLTLAVRPEGDLPVQIRTDAVRLRQIFIHLINDAISWTYKGEINITVSMSKGDPDHPQLKLEMSEPVTLSTDTIPNRLVDPLESSDGATTPAVAGSGLGLCISHKLAVALGGSLSCETTSGRGHTLVLLLPVTKAEACAVTRTGLSADAVTTPVAQVPDRALAGYRILLAEDGVDSQRLISAILTHRGAEVSVVENGQLAILEALSAESSENPFDVVLLDMQMPVMDGYAAARQLRRAGYTRPIIAVTANVMPQDQQLCLAAGCDDYSRKPIDKGQLVESILRLVGCATNDRVNEPVATGGQSDADLSRDDDSNERTNHPGTEAERDVRPVLTGVV